MMIWRNTALVHLGLWGPPLLWAATLQLGEILPYFDCTHNSHRSAIMSFSALAVASLIGVLAPRGIDEESPREHRFLAALARLSSYVFAFALLLQSIATLVFSGCEK